MIKVVAIIGKGVLGADGKIYPVSKNDMTLLLFSGLHNAHIRADGKPTITLVSSR